jgi:hypothetical protein
MQKPITLESLGDLDNGRAKLIIDAAIRQAVFDIDDRGDDGKPRQVVITLSLSKLPEHEAINMGLTAHAKLPPRRTGGTLGLVKAQAGGEIGVLFQTHASTEPHQRTLDEAESPHGVE